MKQEKFTGPHNSSAQDGLREESSNPAPLYNQTNRNFQRQNLGPQQGNNHDEVTGSDQRQGSSSDEEKDII